MEWLAIDESREEWSAATDKRWANFSEAERQAHVKLLLSPFELSPELMKKFEAEVDSSNLGHLRKT
jgi:hypothetical protein